MPSSAKSRRTAAQASERTGDTTRYYNRSVKDLPKLKSGDKVKMKPTETSTNIWQKATVVRKIDDRSYIVETLEEQHIAVIDIISERRQSHLRRQNQSNKLN